MRNSVEIGEASEITDGTTKEVLVQGYGILLARVGDNYYAADNRCPHMGGTLCEGPLTGTALATDEYHFEYGRQGQILRCGWHGWEFDVTTGQALVDPGVRARTYQVTVENGSLIVHI